jgi:hypothetical protein
VKVIGALAAAAGTTAKTVRFYEQAGLLPGPPRTTTTYRNYPDHAAAAWPSSAPRSPPAPPSPRSAASSPSATTAARPAPTSPPCSTGTWPKPGGAWPNWPRPGQCFATCWQQLRPPTRTPAPAVSAPSSIRQTLKPRQGPGWYPAASRPARPAEDPAAFPLACLRAGAHGGMPVVAVLDPARTAGAGPSGASACGVGWPGRAGGCRGHPGASPGPGPVPRPVAVHLAVSRNSPCCRRSSCPDVSVRVVRDSARVCPFLPFSVRKMPQPGLILTVRRHSG